jgi:hypothetical protein
VPGKASRAFFAAAKAFQAGPQGSAALRSILFVIEILFVSSKFSPYLRRQNKRV